MRLKNVLWLAAIVGTAAWLSKKPEADDPPPSYAAQSDPMLVERSSPFRCEGKTRCSQMTSCDEAMFYLKHCAGTQMDGDNDGVPCESQHCGH